MSPTRSILPLLSSRLAIAAALLLAVGSPVAVQAHAQNAVEPHTQAAVIADDDHWGKAETEGDQAYVDHLLLPEYRSISSDGSIHDKAAILANTKKNVNSPDRAAANEKWKATHPYVTSVLIVGDTAVLTFSLDRPTSPKPVLSSDIFVYRDGRWRALYSQHSEAGN